MCGSEKDEVSASCDIDPYEPNPAHSIGDTIEYASKGLCSAKTVLANVIVTFVGCVRM